VYEWPPTIEAALLWTHAPLLLQVRGNSVVLVLAVLSTNVADAQS
jgi:hypothetical protein